MHRILVTGANGQLGSELRFLSENYPYQFYFTDVEQLNITIGEEVEQYIAQNKIDVIINCAAYTAVDKAESDFELADLINNKAVELLSKLTEKFNAKLVHISTDYVFDGLSYIPYTPLSATIPKSTYGITKRLGEEHVVGNCLKNALILRTAWVYSSYGNNFVKTILKLASEKENLNIVSDQIGTPTYARDLARFILDNLNKINWSGTKIFHYTNEGVCSWFDFAKMICQLKNIECDLNPIPSVSYPTPAPRPYFSVLSKEETKTYFKTPIPYWVDSLKDCLKLI
jgi:dTDP-4-dehydrorhamnose reductase